MMHVLVTAVEERMEVDIKEVRQDAGERFYWQDHQLTADSVGGQQQPDKIGSHQLMAATQSTSSPRSTTRRKCICYRGEKRVWAYFNDVE